MWLTLALVIIALVIGIFLKEPINTFQANLRALTKTIRNYWIFVIIFSLTTASAYFLLLYFASENKIDLYISILNNCSTLIFAIFVGYFAFRQLLEARFHKIVDRANDHLVNDEFTRAVNCLEEANKIQKDDFDINCNLTELYLVTEQSENMYLKQLKYTQSLVKEPVDSLVVLLLKAENYLLNQENGEALKTIKEIVDYVRSKPESVYRMTKWDFHQIQSAPAFKKLTEGSEAKKLFNNLINYLSRRLSPEEVVTFENGDYVLSKSDKK